MPLLASIDVGSNTVRLLAAVVERGRITREVLNLRETTRLAEGLEEGGSLKPEARERTVNALKGYASRLRDAGVKGVSAVATEALRKAGDAEAFIGEVWEKTGLELRIISGEEEGRLTMLGVMAGIRHLGIHGPKLLVDIGGGSTELILTDDWRNHKTQSLSLGAVSLFERHLLLDPPSGDEMEDLAAHCMGALGAISGFIPGKAHPTLIGTAGTITTLAAVDLALDVYAPEKVTGHRMSRDTIKKLLQRLAGLPKENRRLIAGVEPGREDIIVSGTILLAAIMDRVDADFIIACDWGLREGNLLDYFENKGN